MLDELLARLPDVLAGTSDVLAREDNLARELASLLDCDWVVAKRRRWPLDSTILRAPAWASDEAPFGLAVKVHPDAYPIAAHVYSSQVLMDRLRACPHAATVLDSVTVASHDDVWRLTTFYWVGGITAGEAVRSPDADLTAIRQLIADSVYALLDIGAHPLLRDVDDFKLVPAATRFQIAVMTDFNALLDCHLAPPETRRDALAHIRELIDELFDPRVAPYIGALPSARALARRHAVAAEED